MSVDASNRTRSVAPAPIDTALKRSLLVAIQAEMKPPKLQPMTPTRALSTHPLAMRSSTPETMECHAVPRTTPIVWLQNQCPFCRPNLCWVVADIGIGAEHSLRGRVPG